MVASGYDSSGHLSKRDADGFTLRGDDDDLLIDLDSVFVSEDTGEHDLGTIADSVDRRILKNKLLRNSMMRFGLPS